MVCFVFACNHSAWSQVVLQTLVLETYLNASANFLWRNFAKFLSQNWIGLAAKTKESMPSFLTKFCKCLHCARLHLEINFHKNFPKVSSKNFFWLTSRYIKIYMRSGWWMCSTIWTLGSLYFKTNIEYTLTTIERFVPLVRSFLSFWGCPLQ